MARNATIRYSYQDYLSIPEGSAGRHEIVDGELHVTPTPRVKHQRVVRNLLGLLHEVAREHGVGEVLPGPITVLLHDELVLEPDVVFVAAARLGILDPEGVIHGPPDLVVEVLSPSNHGYDRGLKRKRYLESGVPELWIVDADARTVEVWRAGMVEPLRPDDALEWAHGARTFRIELAKVFE